MIDDTPVVRLTGVTDLDFAGDELLCRTRDGIFRHDGQRLVEVARVGGSSPLGEVYVAFGQITLGAGHPGYASQTAFTATLSDGRKTLVIGDRQVLTTGAQIGDGVLEDFMISRMGHGVCVVAKIDGARVILHAQADLVMWNDFSLASSDPAWCAPAISGELGVFAAGKTLVTSAMGIGSEIIALADESFGPPVASSGGDPFGVAARTGNRLWLGVFSAGFPLSGAAVAPLDETDGVEHIQPIKLTNTGILLLRANVSGERSLFTLDKLLDWYGGKDSHATS